MQSPLRPPAPSNDAVHADMLCAFPDLAEELGLDAGALLRAAGLDPGRVGAGVGAASYRQTAAVLEAAAATSGLRDVGLRLAARQGGTMFGPLGEVMRNAATLDEALAYAHAHAHAHSAAAAIWSRPGTDGLTFFGHDILLDDLPGRPQLIEQILLLGHLGAQELTGGFARARRVSLRHRPISRPETYRRYFHCEVRFEQAEDGLHFAGKDLARPVVTAEAGGYERAVGYVEGALRDGVSHRAQVRAVLLRRLGAQPCAIGQVACALKLHPRTLRRRLEAEATSFRQVKEEVRRDLLLFYLARTDLDAAGISIRLGFAEQAVMTRFCVAWFALPPTRLRDALTRLQHGPAGS